MVEILSTLTKKNAFIAVVYGWWVFTVMMSLRRGIQDAEQVGTHEVK